MFLEEYIFEKSPARYSDALLLLDDGIGEWCGYKNWFAAAGFEIVAYENDLQFRIDWEESLRNGDCRIAVMASPADYIPFDIAGLLNAFPITFTNIFPGMDSEVLDDLNPLEIDLLSYSLANRFVVPSGKREARAMVDVVLADQSNASDYLAWARQHLEHMVGEARTYRDWLLIAPCKAAIDVVCARFRLNEDLGFCNERFEEFVLTEYGRLSTCISNDAPVLVAGAMEYIHVASAKSAIIVMDGMSWFDWLLLRDSFGDLAYEEKATFALIPTVTSVSRQCLLSNKLPVQLNNAWSQSGEKTEFFACGEDLGVDRARIDYQRGYDADFAPRIEYAAVIINDIDEMVHGQIQGRIGMYNDDRVLTEQGKLAGLVNRLVQQGFDVYITADHGNTPCVGEGRPTGLGVEVETRSKRMIVLKDFADGEALAEKYRLIKYPGYYLDKAYEYYICDAGISFDPVGHETMSHGGITIDEVIVPFIKVEAVGK